MCSILKYSKKWSMIVHFCLGILWNLLKDPPNSHFETHYPEGPQQSRMNEMQHALTTSGLWLHSWHHFAALYPHLPLCARNLVWPHCKKCPSNNSPFLVFRLKTFCLFLTSGKISPRGWDNPSYPGCKLTCCRIFFFWNTETCLKCSYIGAERDKIISSCKQIFFASRNGLQVNLKLQELGIFRSARRAQPAVTRRRAPLTRTQLRNRHKKKKKRAKGDCVKARSVLFQQRSLN